MQEEACPTKCLREVLSKYALAEVLNDVQLVANAHWRSPLREDGLKNQAATTMSKTTKPRKSPV